MPPDQSVFAPDVCLTDAEDVAQFPDITFAFSSPEASEDGNLYLSVPPSVYFVEYDDNMGGTYYCMGIRPGSGERTVIGDTFMRGFHPFDREEMRAGFAVPNRAACGHIGLLNDIHARYASRPRRPPRQL